MSSQTSPAKRKPKKKHPPRTDEVIQTDPIVHCPVHIIKQVIQQLSKTKMTHLHLHETMRNLVCSRNEHVIRGNPNRLIPSARLSY